MPGDFRGLGKSGAGVPAFLLDLQMCSCTGLPWDLGPFFTLCLGPWGCCGGAGKTWTLASWAGAESGLYHLLLCKQGQSHGCHLLSTICACDSRPTSHQAVSTATASCCRRTDECTHGPHSSRDPGLSTGVLQARGFGRGRLSLGWGLAGAHGVAMGPQPLLREKFYCHLFHHYEFIRKEVWS